MLGRINMTHQQEHDHGDDAQNSEATPKHDSPSKSPSPCSIYVCRG